MYYKNGFFLEPQENSVEPTDKQYEALIIGQSQGKQIVSDKQGFPVLIEPKPNAGYTLNLDTMQWEISVEKQAEYLAQKQTQWMTEIDNKAASIYSIWTRFESEYRERKDAALAFQAANYQGEVSRYITDFAEKAGITNQAATQLILQQAAGLERLQVELANQRMRKYELKKDGLSETAKQTIFDDIIQQMNQLAEAYQNG